MKEIFIDKKFKPDSLAMIDTINDILSDYEAQGFRLSLRQLYYQLVSRALIPNDQQSYSRIGDLVSNARNAGLVDWDMIEDRGRNTVANSHWSSPGSIVNAAAYGYRIDKWANQPWHVEVMVEKDALSGVLEPVCSTLDISITANKGYSSSSTMYEIGKRLARKADVHGKDICIIYLGDHDPSGIDMTRDVGERLALYSGVDDIEVVRIALNMPQVEAWQPPENPAKLTDSRVHEYLRLYGPKSWELDAVEPRTLAELVTEAVLDHRDEGLWKLAVQREEDERDQLKKMAESFGKSA